MIGCATPSEPVSVDVLTVSPQEAGSRLDHFLVHYLPDHSRSAISRLVQQGAVQVDGLAGRCGQRLKNGSSIVLRRIPFQDDSPGPLTPVAMDFPVLYEDEAVLVLSKPPGLVVHPACGHWQDTLVHGLLHRYGDLPGADRLRPGIVHRLDKDTSGLLLVARTAEALQRLARAFARREVDKIYHAILLRSPSDDQGRETAAIGRHPVQRQKMAVRPEGSGRPAATSWQVLQRFPQGLCLMELRLETGRTHQIRVHMAARGTPVLGDTLYGGTSLPASWSFPVPRLCLHASRLCFPHPLSGETVEVRAPLWPDLLDLLDRLGVDNEVRRRCMPLA